MKKTPSEKHYSPYPIYLSHQPDWSEPINTTSSARLYQSIPDEKFLLKSNIALTLSTYHISQNDQNLWTHLHQPDYTNPIQMKKLLLKCNIAHTLSTYHISQIDQNLSNIFISQTIPIHSRWENSFWKAIFPSPYLPITSVRPVGTYQHIFISQSIPINSRRKNFFWKAIYPLPYLPITSATLISTYQQIFISKNIPIYSRWKHSFWKAL